MNKLKQLEKKLDKVKKSKIQDNQYHQKPAVNYSIAINISIELIAGSEPIKPALAEVVGGGDLPPIA